MKITIEKLEANPELDIWGGWTVTYGDKYADQLAYEEMLGVVAALTMPDNKPCLHWLKTEEQHKQWREGLQKSSDENVTDVEFE